MAWTLSATQETSGEQSPRFETGLCLFPEAQHGQLCDLDPSEGLAVIICHLELELAPGPPLWAAGRGWGVTWAGRGEGSRRPLQGIMGLQGRGSGGWGFLEAVGA